MATEADVRELALALPATSEKPSYGTPGFRVRDRLFARIREEGVLVLWRESEEEKEALVESEPEKFFTTPHYDGYPNIPSASAPSTARSWRSCWRNPGACALHDQPKWTRACDKSLRSKCLQVAGRDVP